MAILFSSIYALQAHFDSVPPRLRVVDGAKSRWGNLILLDAVICLLELREINEASRRSFNQQKVLIECIVAELERTDTDQYHQYLARDENAPVEYEIALEGMSSHWSDAERLQLQILSDPTTKSREKFVSIVDCLFNHPTLANFQLNLPTILRHVMLRVLQQYPVCAVPTTQEPGTAPAPQDQRSFDPSMFDDIVESELDSQPWDFLDEWMSCSPLTHISTASIASTPASVPVCERPSHPLPLESAGYTVCGASQVPNHQHAQSEFRSIDHLAAEAHSCCAEIHRPTAVTAVRAPAVTMCTVQAYAPSHCMEQSPSPFPDPTTPSVYSRRLSFAVRPNPAVPGLYPAASREASSPCTTSETSATCTSTTSLFPSTSDTHSTAMLLAPGASSGYWECFTGDDDLEFDIDLEGLATCHTFDSEDLTGPFVPISAVVGEPIVSSRKRSCQVLEDSPLGPVNCKPRYAVNH